MSHFYSLKGEPCHFVEKKDGTGTRPSTIRDARANNWVPGVTEVLKVAAKPQLERWKLIQACTAVLTSPRRTGLKCTKCDWSNPHLTFSDTSFCDKCSAPVQEIEALDAFMERVLFADKEQDQEAAKAADLGTRIHGSLEEYFTGKQLSDPTLWTWICFAVDATLKYGKTHAAETILIGNGYGGLCDLILEAPECWWLWDWKTTKTLPAKGAYPEARIQLAAYAAAFARKLSSPVSSLKPICTANCYISTTEQGKFVVCEHDHDWQKVYNSAFLPLLQYWQWVNAYEVKVYG